MGRWRTAQVELPPSACHGRGKESMPGILGSKGPTSATDTGPSRMPASNPTANACSPTCSIEQPLATNPLQTRLCGLRTPRIRHHISSSSKKGTPSLTDGLGQVQNLTEKQRGGVYGTTRSWVNVLSSNAAIPCIRDIGVIGRPEFNHEKFASTTPFTWCRAKEEARSGRPPPHWR